MTLIRRAKTSKSRGHTTRLPLIVATMVAVIFTLITVQPAYAASQSALDPAVLPQTMTDSDTAAVELGMKFSSTARGTVDGVRFYKGTANTGTHTGSVWTESGTLLAQTVFENESASGWQTAKLPSPVTINAGETYVVSYQAPLGRYSSSDDAFIESSTRGHLTVPESAGVYRYGNSALPTESWRDSNYFVDVDFTPTTVPQTEPAPPISPPTSIPPVDADGAGSVGTLRQLDGGPNYFDQFTNSLPTNPGFFPVGIWYESILSADEVETDQNAGINLYVELTSNSDSTLLSASGSYAITGQPMPGTAGRLTTDEADMWGGPGSDAWTGNTPGQGPICAPSAGECGYTIMQSERQQIPAGIMAYTNYGKGVTFWQSDADAARFVNDYQDVVSADNYWFTDPNICGASEGGQLVGGRALTPAECRLAANYGWTIDRLRSLVQPAGSQPVWAFVEVGHPFTESYAPTITGPEIRAAVWSSIIHGARGVIYFNHNFGGDCISQHVLREECGSEVRPMVAQVNAQIANLAPVLNSPFLDGVTSATEGVDHMTKVHDGRVYVFAGSSQPQSQTVEIANDCVGSGPVTVVGESRILSAVAGSFSDTFTDGNAVHIYSAPAAPGCIR